MNRSLLTSLALSWVLASLGCGDEGAQATATDAEIQAAVMAINGGDAAKLREMLEAGVDPNHTYPDGSTLLHIAADLGKTECIRTLLKAGADANRADAGGARPLHKAVTGWSRVELARALIDAGADVNAAGSGGLGPLHVVMGSGHSQIPGAGETELLCPEMVDLLLDRGADVNRADAGGVTPLMSAAGRGLRQTVGKLLDHGAKVSSADGDGWRALHYAAHYGWQAAAVRLLDAGADPNARAADGWSPAALAADSGFPKLVDLLFERGAKEPTWTPLHRAAIRGDARSVERLLAARANIDARDRYGRTPLVWAAGADAPHAAVTLLDAGAAPDLASKSRVRPLHRAVEMGHLELADKLLAAGADPSSPDADGWGPLHYAATRGGDKLTVRLLDAGAPIDAVTADGHTPLSLAVENNHAATGRALLARGASLLAASAVNADDLVFHASQELNGQLAAALLTEREDLLARIERDVEALKAAAPPPADSPENLLHRLAWALAVLDRDVFVGCFTGSSDGLELCGLTLDSARQARMFRREFIAAWGRPAWLKFQGEDGEQGRARFSLSMPTLHPGNVGRARVEVHGDRATASCVPGLPRMETLPLRRTKQGWRIDADGLFPGVPTEGMIDLQRRLLGSVRKARGRIGRPGVTPESLERELLSDLFGVSR